MEKGIGGRGLPKMELRLSVGLHGAMGSLDMRNLDNLIRHQKEVMKEKGYKYDDIVLIVSAKNVVFVVGEACGGGEVTRSHLGPHSE